MATPSIARYFTSSFTSTLVVAMLSFLLLLQIRHAAGGLIRMDGPRKFPPQFAQLCTVRLYVAPFLRRGQHTIKEYSHDCVGQFVCTGIDIRFVPLVNPVHHAKQAEHCYARI